MIFGYTMVARSSFPSHHDIACTHVHHHLYISSDSELLIVWVSSISAGAWMDLH